MTPAYYDPEHLLLRAQLKCLSLQTVKDFDVWMIDPHYQKRKTVIPELAATFSLDIKHIPYTPATHIAKHFDCAIFNAAFIYSRAPLNARYSCYRFARPTWVETMLRAPDHTNVDFYMHALGPDDAERKLNQAEKLNHRCIWWYDGEDVHWDEVPKESGYTDDDSVKFTGHPLANWPRFMDLDQQSPVIVPGNVYGNIAWRRSQWLALNGTNEVITNAAHWEDLDFDIRAANAQQTVVRYPHQLYRLHHNYGEHSHRSTVSTDTVLTRMCNPCYDMLFDHYGVDDYGEVLRNRLRLQTLRHHYQHQTWVCPTCHLSGPVIDSRGLDHYLFGLQDMGVTRSPVLPVERIGRNLSILAEHMDRCPYLDTKVAIFNDSWTNAYYYTP